MKSLLALLLFTAFTTNIFAAENAEFYDKATGVRISKLPEWQYMTREEQIKVTDQVKLNNPEAEKEMQQSARMYSSLVSIMKYPEPYPKINPTLSIALRPSEGLPQDLRKLTSMVARSLVASLQDGQIEGTPKLARLNKESVGYAKINFTFQTQNGNSMTACSELWVVPFDNKSFLLITSGTSGEEGGVKQRKEIQKMLDTFSVEKPD